jgi:hypothetical protein
MGTQQVELRRDRQMQKQLFDFTNKAAVETCARHALMLELWVRKWQAEVTAARVSRNRGPQSGSILAAPNPSPSPDAL